MKKIFTIIFLIFFGLKIYSQTSGYNKFALPLMRDKTKSSVKLKSSDETLPSNSGVLSVTNNAVDGTDMHIYPSWV